MSSRKCLRLAGRLRIKDTHPVDDQVYTHRVDYDLDNLDHLSHIDP